MDNTKSSTSSFIVVYILGALLSLTVAVLATWSDLEAAFYGFDRRGSMPLRDLRCPVIMNRNETGIVSVRISNATERKLSPSVRAEFSTTAVPILVLESVEVEPGESQTVEWTVGPENIDLRRFIFANVYIFAAYPMPDREATCGTFVIGLPIPGSVLLFLMVVLGLAGMGGSLFRLYRSRPWSDRIERLSHPLSFLAILIAVALAAALMGWWVQAILLLAITLLTIVVTVGYLLFR